MDIQGGTMKHFVLSLILFAATSAAHAGLPVVPSADQQKLLASSDASLAGNKKLVYDFSRVILAGLHLDQAANFLRDDYIQHNPNVATGLQGFLDAFAKLGGPRPIPAQVDGLVSIQAEGDMVTMSFVNELKDASGAAYSTTWFDMFRIQDGKIAEHLHLKYCGDGCSLFEPGYFLCRRDRNWPKIS
jgi:predicted SnoaL-like aldol condensation-catalyzing enzyme